MKILAIDTATEGCSASLLIDDQLTSQLQVQPRKHAELILPMVETLLAESELALSQLDCLAFGRGPGAFTGVRIAAGVTQGIAYGADLPVVPVSTLQALAQRTWVETGHSKVLTAFDARMEEVYWAGYELAENGFMQQSLAEQVVKPQQAALPGNLQEQSWVGAGSGWQTYEQVLIEKTGLSQSMTFASMITRADEIAQLAAVDFKLGKFVSADKALPVYLRNSVAWKKAV